MEKEIFLFLLIKHTEIQSFTSCILSMVGTKKK